MESRGPRRCGGELRAELQRAGVEPAAATDLIEAWPRAVGDEIARNAWPARIQRDGTLVVHVRDAVWGFELSQRAAEIAPRLPGSPKLKFVPGPLPDRVSAAGCDAGRAASGSYPGRSPGSCRLGGRDLRRRAPRSCRSSGPREPREGRCGRGSRPPVLID